MEYRDLSRSVARDGDDDAEGPPPMRRFEFPRGRGRLDARKVAAASILAASALAVLFYAGGHAIHLAIEFVNGQPRYQLPFNQIELPEPPPECFLGGATTFLDRVRTTASEPEVLPLLDVTVGEIRDAFKRFPWVKEVVDVKFDPGRLVVHLKYRRPVARVQVEDERRFTVDSEGCILPREDVDPDEFGRLVWIRGKNLAAPDDDRVGKIWKTETAKTPQRAAADRGVIQAARLAGFLMEPERVAEAESSHDLKINLLSALDPNGDRGIFAKNERESWILWGRPPGEEEPGEPIAAEKWKSLVRQAREKDGVTSRKKSDYWTFGRDGMRYVETAS